MADARGRRPNVLFVFSDQQRWDTMGCYGQPLEVTPHLDRIAAEGTRFELAFTCQPVCGPARSCLQTGKYATETGCFRNDIALPQDAKTIGHWFGEAGYEVGYIGKWHLASQGEEQNYRAKAVPPEWRGGYKDHWLASDVLEFTSHGYDGHMFDGEMKRVDFEGYRVDCHTDFVLDYLRTRTGEQPFFLFVSYIEPHHQNDRNRFEGPDGSKERFKSFVVPGDLKGLEGDWAEQYPDYLGCCWSLDQNVGRIRAELERLGQWENTVVVYTSDHGCHFRTRNGEYKRACHDGCLRIPMIAHGPGFAGGGVVSELVSLIDIPPTLLACAGTPTPEPMRGRPLQGLVDGTAQGWPDDVFAQISESHVGRCVRTRRWKYSVRGLSEDPHAGARQPACAEYRADFLYDLENDPHERWNLVADAGLAEVRAEMRERLLRRMTEAGEAPPEILPPV